jgi:peptide/nickel transport system permease protein
MLSYIAHRVALGIVSLLLLSMMVFAAAQVLPGNPGQIVLGREAPASEVKQFNHRLGIDRPLPVRYVDWLSHAVRGDFGANYSDGRPVTDDLVPALKRSLFLAIYAFILCIPVSIFAGVMAALRRGRLTDRVITVGGLSLAVIPEFVQGAILVTLLGPAALNLFPGTAGPLIGASFWTKLDSLFLPALALALVLFGYIARMARAGTMEALDADFTRTAVLKGMPWRNVLGRHVLRNGLLPTIAVISTQVGYLFGGIVAIEKLFGYPGIGFLTITAASVKNFPMLLACVLILGIVYFVATLSGDLLTAALNPRVRLRATDR